MRRGRWRFRLLSSDSAILECAESRRATTTIPVDAIGNDRPIQVRSFRNAGTLRTCKSTCAPERRDPRTGDVVFQLTNIRRGEPSRATFEVPAGYAVKVVVKAAVKKM